VDLEGRINFSTQPFQPLKKVEPKTTFKKTTFGKGCAKSYKNITYTFGSTITYTFGSTIT
jgi:hypothetical protein